MYVQYTQDVHVCIHTPRCMMAILGFSNGTLERRYSRIMLSPPQNMKPYVGHYDRIMRGYSLLRVLLCFLI